MAQIFKFPDSPQELMERARDFFEKEDYANAVDLYYRAYDKAGRRDPEIALRIGEVYYETGDCGQAIIWLLRSLSMCDTTARVYELLIASFYAVGTQMHDVAMYYFNYGKERGVATANELETIAAWNDDIYDRIGSEVKDNSGDVNESLRLQRSRDFIKNNAVASAYSMFAAEKADPRHYESAKRIIMRLDMERTMYENVRDAAEELLKAHPDEFEALIYAAQASHCLGDYEKRDSYYARITPSADENTDNIEFAALLAGQMGRYDDAVYYLEIFCDEMPFMRDQTLHLAQAYANVGDKRAAMREIVTLARLYPDDAGVRYYRDRIAAARTKTLFELIDTIPELAAIKRENLISSIYKKEGAEGLYEQMKTNREVADSVDWLFQEGDMDLQIELGYELAKSPLFRPMMEELLLMPAVDGDLKRAIILGKIDDEDQAALKLACGDIYRVVNYKALQGVSNRVKALYCYAYASLVLYCDGFEADLDRLFTEAAQRIDAMKERAVDYPALSAALCYYANVARGKEDVHMYSDIFCCRIEKLRDYVEGKGINMKGLYSYKGKDPKRGYYGIRY